MSLPIIIILTIAGYFGLLMAVSAVASRGSDNSTFFTGNRRVPWFVVAFAMIGAPISGVTFISVPGMVADKGYSYLQMVLGFIVGYVLIAFVLVPLFYRKNMLSIYGYLEERFGSGSYRTGAWFFFVSKMLGAAVRFFVVCSVLQLLVFGPLGVPFIFNVIVTIALIWLYTVQGGVKTLIWTDTLKSFCLIGSIVLCIFFIASDLGFDFKGMVKAIADHESSRMFFFDNPKESTYFWKQFIAGVFMAIATTGLDQDMMQRNLACNHHSIALPEKSDDIFGMVATSDAMPVWVGILFVLGLIAAAYSAAGSALTSLTTSFTVDILGAHRQNDQNKLTRTRRNVHIGMSVIMGAVIVVFYYMSNQDAISAVYTLASYTYGPILGLFVFGMFSKRLVRDRLVPAVCIAAPVLSWGTQWALVQLWGYHTGFELLLINACYTMLGLWISAPRTVKAVA